MFSMLSKKRGQIETVLGIVAFVLVSGIIVAGSFIINQHDTDYVGDINTKLYYNINCLSKVPEQSRVLVSSKESAETLNFTYSEC